MRKFLLPLMLASVALPAAAMASDQDQNDHRAARAEQRAEHADRGDRNGAQQAARPMQSQPQMQRGPAAQVQAERQVRQFDRQGQRGGFGQGQSPYVRPDRGQRNWTGEAAAQGGAVQPAMNREYRNRGPRVITTDGLPNDGPRGGFERGQRPDPTTAEQVREQGRRYGDRGTYGRGGSSYGTVQSAPISGGGELRRSSSGAQWGTRWRNDPRYDWRDWRNHHRSSFHIGFYSDPYGYGYQRLNYGFTLNPGYYQPNYWLQDPWQYRLPPVYGPYRWVRYWDDAVLVDICSGEVVDVIYDFFW